MVLSPFKEHVASQYGRQAEQRYLDEWRQGRYPYRARPGDIERDAATAGIKELYSARHMLAASNMKPDTLQYLHESLHRNLGDVCQGEANGEWFGYIIHEPTSLEDVMAAKKATTTKQQTTKIEIRYVPDARLGEVFTKAHSNDPTGFLPADQLELVDQPGFVMRRRSANHPRNLQTIYQYYQRIDGAAEERTEQLKVRSMSAGDAIVVDGVAYYVADTGFVTKNDDGTISAVEAPAEV